MIQPPAYSGARLTAESGHFYRNGGLNYQDKNTLFPPTPTNSLLKNPHMASFCRFWATLSRPIPLNPFGRDCPAGRHIGLQSCPIRLNRVRSARITAAKSTHWRMRNSPSGATGAASYTSGLASCRFGSPQNQLKIHLRRLFQQTAKRKFFLVLYGEVSIRRRAAG